MTLISTHFACWRALFIAAGLYGFVGCSSPGSAHSDSAQSAARRVPSSAFAVVGGEPLSAGLLSKESLADRLAEAEGLVHDELLRQQAIAVTPHEASVVARGVLARRMFQQLEKEAEDSRPVSASDLESAREKEWLFYNRPRAVRTVEVFIPVAPMADDRPAYALAQRISEAVQGAANLESFLERARAVPEAGTLQAFRAPPVAKDGRVVPMTPQDQEQIALDIEYAKAATALTDVGDVSAIVGNAAGFHILYAVEIIPELRPESDLVTQKLKRLVLKSRVDGLARAINGARNTRVQYRHRSPARLIQTIGHSL